MPAIRDEIKTILILMLSLTIFSCNRQIDSKYSYNNTSSSSSVNTNISDFTETKEIIDPLFFIEGQLCQHVREIFQDSKGNLWFGTNVYDLMMYNGDTLQYITKKDGFSGGRVTGISEDSYGNIWFATGLGLNRFDGESFTIFRERNGLPNSEIWSFLIDSKGIFWIGHNEGLCLFDGTNFENIEVPKSNAKEVNTIYSKNRITAIVEDQNNNFWIGTDGYGICKYDGKSFTHFTIEDGLCDNTIADLMIDSKGNLWIGTYWGGVSKYDGVSFTNYSKKGDVLGVEVYGFFEDKESNIWFGVENHGVYKYNRNSFRHYSTNDGLKGSILSIYKDNENRFWFGGWGGLFRLDDNSFRSVTKDGPWKQ